MILQKLLYSSKYALLVRIFDIILATLLPYMGMQSICAEQLHKPSQTSIATVSLLKPLTNQKCVKTKIQSACCMVLLRSASCCLSLKQSAIESLMSDTCSKPTGTRTIACQVQKCCSVSFTLASWSKARCFSSCSCLRMVAAAYQRKQF